MAQCGNNAGGGSGGGSGGNNNNTASSNASNNTNSFGDNSSSTAANSAVQQVANAVAAAVIASEHQNHLNNLKSRFQSTTTGKHTINFEHLCIRLLSFPDNSVFYVIHSWFMCCICKIILLHTSTKSFAKKILTQR
uniref:Uncharacterized protein n=1 Tax=Stomoxys calcitrans TaxID=35570 RepID=A0A1I8Q9D7_STOCA